MAAQQQCVGRQSSTDIEIEAVVNHMAKENRPHDNLRTY